MDVNKRRYETIDLIRGITIISMVLYHTMWDLVNLFSVNAPWFHGAIAHIWQQSICWVFILISGFCIGISRNPVRRGVVVTAAGMIISAVTAIFMPSELILFGVLTLIGAGMLIFGAADKFLRRLPQKICLLISVVLFVLLRNVNEGYIGFEGINIISLPSGLYHGILAAFIGFTPADFDSADYFSIIPWIFLFAAGYFLYGSIKPKLNSSFFHISINPINWIGRHSLIIYMLHQVVIYAVLYVIFAVI